MSTTATHAAIALAMAEGKFGLCNSESTSKNEIKNSIAVNEKEKVEAGLKGNRQIAANSNVFCQATPNSSVSVDINKCNSEGRTDIIAPPPPTVHDKNKKKKIVIEGKKKKSWKKPKDKPKRPLSAYNLFFQYERQLMLGSDVMKDNEPDKSSEKGGQKAENGGVILDDNGESFPAHSKHNRKIHGKINFADMARVIGAKWKALDDNTRLRFKKQAEEDKTRYLEELNTWKKVSQPTKKQQNVNNNNNANALPANTLPADTLPDMTDATRSNTIQHNLSKTEERENETAIHQTSNERNLQSFPPWQQQYQTWLAQAAQQQELLRLQLLQKRLWIEARLRDQQTPFGTVIQNDSINRQNLEAPQLSSYPLGMMHPSALRALCLAAAAGPTNAYPLIQAASPAAKTNTPATSGRDSGLLPLLGTSSQGLCNNAFSASNLATKPTIGDMGFGDLHKLAVFSELHARGQSLVLPESARSTSTIDSNANGSKS